jgi:hypothetical protein
MELSNLVVSWEMICDISKKSVYCSLSAPVPIDESGYTGPDAWNQYHNNSNTLEYWSNTIYQGNHNFIFVYLLLQKLNPFNQGNVVFADKGQKD